MSLSGPALGVALGLGASVAWAVANIFIRRAARLAGDLVPILWGQGIGALVLALALPIWPPVRMPESWGWLLVGGLASAAGYVGLFRSFGRGPVSVLSPIIAAWGLISAAIGVGWFGEALPPLRAVGALLVVGGAMGIAGQKPLAGVDEGWVGPRWRVVGWAVASALGFGVMVAALGPVAKDLGPVGGILGVWAVEWCVLLPVAWRVTGGRLLPPRTAAGALVGVGLTEATGFLLVEVGALTAPISVVAPAAGTAALVTVVLGRVWLGEAVGWVRLVLAAVAVTGIALLASG